MEVWGNASIKVTINPISVVENINVLPRGAEWIKVEEENGKTIYALYEETSAGSHSFDSKIGETTKEIYDLYMSQKLLLAHLRKQEDSKRR